MKESDPKSILKSFPKEGSRKLGKNYLIIISVAVVLMGVLTGWFLAKPGTKTAGDTASSKDVTKTQNEAGVGDDSAFPDSAQGILVEGGIQGEGTHHLERPGGASQSVYLTSTIIDLSSFVGKKVEVRGQTLSAVKAGWLMDVGKVKVIN